MDPTEVASEEHPGRKTIGKKLRFEVLKRDSFKCRYCGKTAEQAPLHVDHVKPVAGGGTNDIMNLVTACAACNLGKRDIPLDDKSHATAARRQAEILQEQKEILEMMAEWRAGLRDLEGQKVSLLVEHWHAMTPGYVINESFKPEFRRWLKRYSFEEITEALDTSARQYLEFDEDGKCTPESFSHALGKVAPILKWQRKFAEDPTLERLLYIRGIARKRCPRYFPDRQAMDLLKEARDAGVSMDDLKSAALSARNYTSFEQDVESLISSAFRQQSADRSSREVVNQSRVEDTANENLDTQLSDGSQELEENWFEEQWSTDLGDHLSRAHLIASADLIEGRTVSEIKADRVWLCDHCSRPLRESDSPIVLRYIGPDQLHRLMLKHRQSGDCHIEGEGWEHVGNLKQFIDSNAVNEFANLLQKQEYNSRALSELMKRCLVPGYELAHYHFAFALQKRVVDSYNSDGCFWDWQLDRILVWLGAKGPFLAPWESSWEASAPIPPPHTNEFRRDLQDDSESSGDPEYA
jgi:hypothetical protein